MLGLKFADRTFRFAHLHHLDEGLRLTSAGAGLIPFESKHKGHIRPEGTDHLVDILNRALDRDEVERGQVVAVPGSITPHTKFKAEVYVLKKEEGGRHTPFFPGYRPQFYFRTTDVTGVLTLPEGVEMVMPGDNVNIDVQLITPVALEKELRFAIREGGRTVGAGVITDIVA